MRTKKRKVKKKVKILIVLIIVLLLLSAGLFVYMKTNKHDTTQKPKVVNEISEYGYVLESDQTKLYKDLFKKLAKVLKEEEVDYDEYAKLISQMAVIDFYNLDNKTSKNDIGGTQFIRKDNVDNFILQASETVYKYVEQNLDGKRSQELPIVTSVEVKDLKNEKYSYKKISDDNAYIITLTLGYKKDLGYPTEVEVRLLHTDKKLEIYYLHIHISLNPIKLSCISILPYIIMPSIIR